MSAALIRPHKATDNDGLYPTRPARDLGHIAALIELCFGQWMDASGQAALAEMRTLSELGPLLWLISLFDREGEGLGMGYVWRVGGKVVGNASLYAGVNHPDMGKGWLVANVAVHPDYRRQGIARALMQAVLDRARQNNGRWVALQVEVDNLGAQQLYDSLGFTRYETLMQWENTAFYQQADTPSPIWRSALRQHSQIAQEMDLIYHRARVGAMAWTQPIDRTQIESTFWEEALMFLGGHSHEHYVLPDPAAPQHLLGAAWLELAGWRQARLTLFIDPALEDRRGRQALLLYFLSHPRLQGWSIRVEAMADDGGINDILRAYDFSPRRNLIQMRKEL
jgi:ribosomal protein S18 acetylase RimI-like enzyme